MIVTPVDTLTGQRITLSFPETEAAKVKRGRRWQATITDDHGRRWRLWSKACDLPGCMCDAYARLVKP